MKYLLWAVGIFCQVSLIWGQGQDERFYPFAATRENYMRQRQFVERLQREYAQQAQRQGVFFDGSSPQSSRFSSLRLVAPFRQQRDNEEVFEVVPQSESFSQVTTKEQIMADTANQIRQLQQSQQDLLVSQGKQQQAIQQQLAQQQLVTQQQQLAFQPPPQLTADQLEEFQKTQQEIQKQNQFVAQNQGVVQTQILQQGNQQQLQIQQQIQQVEVNEQLQLQQADQQRKRSREQPVQLPVVVRSHNRLVRQEPMTEICLACICQASTSCNLTTQCVSNGQYCGPFLISKPYWLDAGSPTLLGDNPQREGAFQDCTADPVCSAQTVRTYMTKYSKDCNNDGHIDCNDLGRIHLMGPYSCSDPSVTQTPFFRKFEQCFTRASSF